MMQCRIYFVKPSRILPDTCHNKWYVSASVKGPDNDSVFRYLKPDGTWQKHTFYFDTAEAVLKALFNYQPPDFSLSNFDLHNRQMIRDDVERGFEYDEFYDEIDAPWC